MISCRKGRRNDWIYSSVLSGRKFLLADNQPLRSWLISDVPAGLFRRLVKCHALLFEAILVNQICRQNYSRNAQYPLKNGKVVFLPKASDGGSRFVIINKFLATFRDMDMNETIRVWNVKRYNIQYWCRAIRRLPFNITISLHVEKPIPILALIVSHIISILWHGKNAAQKVNLPLYRSFSHIYFVSPVLGSTSFGFASV